jgi:CubicO group peptidase (beta-lactamase class C family)
MKKWAKLASIVFILGIVLLYFLVLHPKLPVVNGYAAKKICSCHFIADRDIKSIESQDLGFFPVSLTNNEVDAKNKTVKSSFFGLVTRTAVFRKGYGCTLLPRGESTLAIETPVLSIKDAPNSLFWPIGEEPKDTVFKEINYTELGQALNAAFGPQDNLDKLGTRAVVVVYKNQLIGEKYAPGFDARTEILGWSKCKSVLNTLVGILVKDGKLRLEQKNLYEEWLNDDRKNISLDNLLQMSSGLDWDEDYSTISDVTRMLYLAKDVPDLANDAQLAFSPGKKWYYSSGTSNLISGIIRQQFDSLDEYLQFPRKALFDKINMSSAVMELDASGNFIGSSYCFATPRDWAKFGLLYLNNGNWFGEQILSEEWIEYTRTTTPGSHGEYGAHFWHNENGVAYPDVAYDLYSANGFQGQRTFIIPSKDLVIVRMGLTDSSKFDFNSFLKRISDSVKD